MNGARLLGSMVSRLVAVAAAVTVMAGPEASEAAPPRTSVPSRVGQIMLIRNALTAVNHGNLTGNYTVLRDLTSPRFRQQHKASDLAATFARIRGLQLDLSPILVTEPKLTRPPSLDRYGNLTLQGFFPTQPSAVHFLLCFSHVGGGWMIDELTVAVVPNQPASPNKTPQPKRPKR